MRWWDGKGWTRHTAPNDARAHLRGRPRRVLAIVVMSVCIVLAALGLIGAVYVSLMAYGLSQWASNK